ncbi:hypothetical protein GCM10023185_15610 [Hymenobacter saemangeumensis]|uniref:Uncharacterized protein n=1 Tax=Hymenobacter saemangeumensis TaxID=1084522 RepID=A0ABP8I9N2_9BACT
MKVFDLLTDGEDDLVVRGGDLEIGESTEQHQRHILISEKGWWRGSPLVGVGLRSMLLDDAPGAVVSAEIQEQMELDGMTISQLALSTDGQLYLLASYKDENG